MNVHEFSTTAVCYSLRELSFFALNLNLAPEISAELCCNKHKRRFLKTDWISSGTSPHKEPFLHRGSDTVQNCVELRPFFNVMSTK